MIEPFLKKQLEPVARRHQRSRVLIRWAQCWWLTVGACLLVWLGCFALSLSPQAPVLSCIGVGLLLGIWQWKQQRSWAPDYREIARKIESQHPQLHALLLTAIEQKPDPVTGQFNFLQERVIEQAVQESRRHSWIESVPTSTLFKARLGHLAGIAALATIAVWVRSPSAPGVQVARSKPVDHFKGKTRITVLPGDVEVEKGTPLVLMARFEGTLPASVNVTLIPTSPTASSASAAPRQIALVKSL
ncbi:MAG: hypothetical protein FJ405_05275, partial [Verrucomicrobia bacterium]|nr:hypothetical protein [Verrucomicrobiota bacterium]